ncbi:MAG: uracil-DNA glycosylase [Bacteroidota bacterium]|nr:uracil-DNA glycosylase [Bacteroidota bacterium]
MSDISRYLRQLKDRYGETLYLEKQILREAELAAQGLAEEGGTVTEAWNTARTLAQLDEMICHCVKCPLSETRNRFVFGVGNPKADVVLVGEAPGAEEDRQGEPFVGRAGKLLDKILEAVDFKREDVFICNILKCRPPNNRDPLPAEVEQCEPYLHKQLALLKPKVMLALGRIAAQTLLRSNESLTRLRAETHSYQGIPLIVTYHPAALLRNPNWKRPTWEDVQKFRALYDERMAAAAKGGGA